jgi:hypothetical protein
VTTNTSRLLEALSTLCEINCLKNRDIDLNDEGFQNEIHCYDEATQCFVIALQEILLQVKSFPLLPVILTSL